MTTRTEIEELMAQWRQVMAASRPHWGSVDLTFTQLRALSTISRRGRMRVSDLADELGVGLGAASALTDRMARHGLVSRRAQEGDRRIVLLEVSSRGRKLLDRLEQGRTEHFGKLIEHMTAAERDALAVVLRAFVRLSADHAMTSGPHGAVTVPKDVR